MVNQDRKSLLIPEIRVPARMHGAINTLFQKNFYHFLRNPGTTKFDVNLELYVIELTSDDGVRLYLDGKMLIDNWDLHEPETDEITVRLGGRHTIRIEHFEAGGFSTLDFRIRPK